MGVVGVWSEIYIWCLLRISKELTPAKGGMNSDDYLGSLNSKSLDYLVKYSNWFLLATCLRTLNHEETVL